MNSLAATLTVFTLNLHGYHPMGEPARYLQDRAGKITLSTSDDYFFTLSELDQGHRRRLDKLAADVAALSPDIALFQEVGAGSPSTPRDCNAFRADPAADAFEKNTVLRLQARLNGSYQADVACRGNVGWTTDANTLKDQRVLRFTGVLDGPPPSSATPEVVYDFGANPYPQGQIVEGLAILLKPTWKILDRGEWDVQYDYLGDRIFTQVLVVAPPSGGWMVVANQHLGRKVQHFEEAVAIRRAVASYVSWNLATRKFAGAFLGTLIGGDFNAQLYQPTEKSGTVATMPWQVKVPGEYDLSNPAWIAGLSAPLHQLNLDTKQDGDVITDPGQADRRISDALGSFADFVRNFAGPGSLDTVDALSTASRAGRCPAGLPAMDGACDAADPDRIDILLSDTSWTIQSAWLAYSHDTWTGLQGPTDHPGVVATYQIGVSDRRSEIEDRDRR